jgi:hypothetical protein
VERARLHSVEHPEKSDLFLQPAKLAPNMKGHC